jgi:cyclophilin family peptidyl-prolyl cis-trans isomerase
MLQQHHVISTVRHCTYAFVTVCAAIFVVACGQQATVPSSNHLASIQSAVTCPAPPAHRAVTSPSHTFSAAPRQVIQHNVGYCAYIDTNRGVISVRLRPEHAPNAVNDFVYLAEHGFYDGLTFYQLCPAVTAPSCPVHATAAVAGDPTATGAGGPGYTVKADPVVGEYLFGAVAMSSTNPSTIGSQFFISKGDSSAVARKYDIFGQVTDGIPALALLAKGDTILWIAVLPTAPEP